MTGEKVLVTGGGGFIGSHLIPKLVELDYDVYSLDRYVTGRYVLGNQRSVKTIFCNLNDYFSIRKNIRDIKPEYIIHLAALSAVSFSYDHPLEVLETNFLGTVKLAEACLQEVSHFKHFLFAGTSEEYGNQKHVPIKESAELRPNSPYSVSKVAADKYLQYLYDHQCHNNLFACALCMVFKAKAGGPWYRHVFNCGICSLYCSCAHLLNLWIENGVIPRATSFKQVTACNK